MAADKSAIQRLSWHPEVLIIEQSAHLLPWSEATLKSCFSADYENFGYWSVNAELLAFALVQRVSDCWTVMNIATKPAAQRQGIGKQLVHAIQHRAAHQQADIVLEVRSSNTAAQRLYASCGFVLVGCRKGYYPSSSTAREDALVMRWNRD
jgi:[ribosomal protein S18]-alanine N-acetyltransferase